MLTTIKLKAGNVYNLDRCEYNIIAGHYSTYVVDRDGKDVISFLNRDIDSIHEYACPYRPNIHANECDYECV